MKRLIIPVFIPFQGCPERCIYCDQTAITGEENGNELPSRDKIEGEIRRYASYSREKEEMEIAFYGGTFTALPPFEQERLLEAAQTNSVWIPDALRISTHPSYISDEVIARLNQFGVSTVELGVQSMEPAVLENLGRNYSPERVLEAISLLKSAGITVGVQLMVGTPGETKEGFLKGLGFLVAESADFFRLYPLQVFQGTALEAMLRKGTLQLPDEKTSLEILETAMVFLELENRPIFRVGLPKSGETSDGLQEASQSLLHDPSLKHRILSIIAGKLMQKALDECGNPEKATFRVNPKRLTEYIGHRKENLLALKGSGGDFKGKNIRIQCDNGTNFDEFLLETEEELLTFSRSELLPTIYRSYV